jgi:hypothetical protein
MTATEQIKIRKEKNIKQKSVADPDPYAFGPPGFRSVIIYTDPDLDQGPSLNKQ